MSVHAPIRELSMEELATHGGTDSLPEPRYDFSSNANALGPCPHVLRAIRSADRSRYPDPQYAQLRRKIAAFESTLPDRVVVGSGASELILRVIRHIPGAVHQLGPTFSEYARGARLAGRALYSATSLEEFLHNRRQHAGVGFLCWPNNPTGETLGAESLEAAALGGPLVIDLAYASLCEAGISLPENAIARAYRLQSPNKRYGLTGVRGAYMIAPHDGRSLTDLAPSWVIGSDAVTLLESGIERAALVWLEEHLPQLHRWRASLAAALRDLGLPVRESPASFLLAEVGEASRITRQLRERGIRVRDATSFGLDRWIRVSAQAPVARRALIAALREVIGAR